MKEQTQQTRSLAATSKLALAKITVHAPAPRVVLYYNTISLHDGNRVVGSGHVDASYGGSHSNGFGFFAYGAAERALSERLVVGVALDIDRTDYYHPTSVELYIRHAFGPGSTRTASPPKPPGPYSP
jgi:hypothetical protein